MRDADGAVADSPRRARSTGTVILSGMLLLAAFAAVETWFIAGDFYHQDFFDHGWRVVLDNGARIIVTAILFWLIYAPGRAVIAVLMRPPQRRTFPLGERVVVGCCIGLGLWHVVMLVLGVAGLFYRPLMIGLATLVLLASTRYFAEVLTDSRNQVVAAWHRARSGEGVAGIASALAITVALGWVMLLRGLYPGGAGDYFTHYFPYYQAVLDHHGIAPNDVWYHYFYSKGAGLFFLAMLLSSPPGPSLATFCCVCVVALALLRLGRRVAPGSLWPTCAALIYLLYALVGFNQGGSGDFQKDHELTSALMVLTIWAYCLRQVTGERIYLVAAIACGIAASIATQPVGILLGACMAALAGLGLLRRRWQELRDAVVLGACIGIAVFAMFALGYVTIGLATDQPLDLALRFADTKRLDQHGLLAMLALTAWTRENYAAIAPPFGAADIFQLGTFVRLALLWVFFGALLCCTAHRWSGALPRRFSHGGARTTALTAEAAPYTTRRDLAVVLGTLMIVSIAAGHVQSVSYLRFSTFFVPLLLMFGITWAGVELTSSAGRFMRLTVPLLVLVGTLASWWRIEHWPARVSQATANAVRFMDGQYSLADAYTYQQEMPAFGAMVPDGLAAAQHVPPGTRIWSTNTFSAMCMAPFCHIESVISFRMSDRFDDVLIGPPELAKQSLQQGGLNYFLVSTQRPLFDILPDSRLFAPDTIGRYLGIKWTDGVTYLLTWTGPDTTPLGATFLTAYTNLLNAPEHPWFRFREFLPQLNAAVDMLRGNRFGHPIHWPWHEWHDKPLPDISILRATYGANCHGLRSALWAANNASSGNETDYVQRACNAGSICGFRVDVVRMSDPAPGCAKDFSVTYKCTSDGRTTTVAIPKEANGRKVTLDCSDAH